MECLFCKMIKGEIPCKKIYEDEKVIAILDLYPDSDCHTLIIPKKHIEDLNAIDDETLLHINKVAKKLIPVLMDKAKAEALSTRVNFGTSQAIKHYHMHLLPNFHIKPCTVSQEQAYKLLKDAIK
ncbi:histidine triad (HIT) protein [Mycoplasma sp. CAG:956]|nr:HIT domain-containing protein [Bacilli bacterium]CCY88866.1 histidine triad (HIT) protein [Mycoplasma sp. CAG:956]